MSGNIKDLSRTAGDLMSRESEQEIKPKRIEGGRGGR